jgi:Sulfotransferase domain
METVECWSPLMALELVSGRFEDLCFAAKRVLLGPDRVRRARLYCVGTGKSGTHSVVEMFSRNVRARHEPEALELIDKILDRRNGRINELEWTEWLRARDRRLALEVDSSHLNLDLLDFLLHEFPDARFLLTIRDCYSWLNSMFNQSLRFRGKLDPRWVRLGELRAGPGARDYAPEEQVLSENQLANLDSYFSRWKSRNEEVLAKVPAPRLLVVRTDQISQRACEIADFACLPRRLIRLDRTHAFQAPVKQELIRQIDRAFLEQKVERHCRPLMCRFFPEIKSLDDAKL